MNNNHWKKLQLKVLFFNQHGIRRGEEAASGSDRTEESSEPDVFDDRFEIKTAALANLRALIRSSTKGLRVSPEHLCSLLSDDDPPVSDSEPDELLERDAVERLNSMVTSGFPWLSLS
jgi:hypothetical protein